MKKILFCILCSVVLVGCGHTITGWGSKTYYKKTVRKAEKSDATGKDKYDAAEILHNGWYVDHKKENIGIDDKRASDFFAEAVKLNYIEALKKMYYCSQKSFDTAKSKLYYKSLCKPSKVNARKYKELLRKYGNHLERSSYANQYLESFRKMCQKNSWAAYQATNPTAKYPPHGLWKPRVNARYYNLFDEVTINDWQKAHDNFIGASYKKPGKVYSGHFYTLASTFLTCARHITLYVPGDRGLELQEKFIRLSAQYTDKRSSVKEHLQILASIEKKRNNFEKAQKYIQKSKNDEAHLKRMRPTWRAQDKKAAEKRKRKEAEKKERDRIARIKYQKQREQWKREDARQARRNKKNFLSGTLKKLNDPNDVLNRNPMKEIQERQKMFRTSGGSEYAPKNSGSSSGSGYKKKFGNSSGSGSGSSKSKSRYGNSNRSKKKYGSSSSSGSPLTLTATKREKKVTPTPTPRPTKKVSKPKKKRETCAHISDNTQGGCSAKSSCMKRLHQGRCGCGWLTNRDRCTCTCDK
ncbi:MAG: hypothetical protein KC493_06215 [Bacteriovoracaceae bacterium]|nr:hypothetical protein [Bacteriovoracaceae bacterium]